jgi:hypothetical protein
MKEQWATYGDVLEHQRDPADYTRGGYKWRFQDRDIGDIRGRGSKWGAPSGGFFGESGFLPGQETGYNILKSAEAMKDYLGGLSGKTVKGWFPDVPVSTDTTT